MSRHLGDLTNEEFQALVDAVADDVLARFNVAGSIAGAYSIYAALDTCYEEARARLSTPEPLPNGGGNRDAHSRIIPGTRRNRRIT